MISYEHIIDERTIKRTAYCTILCRNKSSIDKLKASGGKSEIRD